MKITKVKGWAVVVCGDIPDLIVAKEIGSLYHICSNKEDAQRIVKSLNDESIKMMPVTITYSKLI